MNKLNKLLGERKRILITGGAGFIGGALIRKLLKESSCYIFNLDKFGYASDESSINNLITKKDNFYLNQNI